MYSLLVTFPSADAPAHFGWVGSLLARDSPSSGAVERELLGWEPTQPGLMADLEAAHYFQAGHHFRYGA